MLLFVILDFIVVKNIVFKLIILILFILSVVTGLLTYLINPGATFIENDKEGNNHYCHLCKFKYLLYVFSFSDIGILSITFNLVMISFILSLYSFLYSGLNR